MGPKSYFTWPFEKRAPWSAQYAINKNDRIRSSEKTFYFKMYHQYVFFFIHWSPWGKYNYDTNLSTEAHVWLRGMASTLFGPH